MVCVQARAAGLPEFTGDEVSKSKFNALWLRMPVIECVGDTTIHVRAVLFE